MLEKQFAVQSTDVELSQNECGGWEFNFNNFKEFTSFLKSHETKEVRKSPEFRKYLKSNEFEELRNTYEFRKHEKKAIDELYDKCHESLLMDARRKVSKKDDVEDCVNSFYVRFINNLHHLDFDETRGSIQSWAKNFFGFHVQCTNHWFDYTPSKCAKELEKHISTIALTERSGYNEENRMNARNTLMLLNKVIEKEEPRKPRITEVLLKLGEHKKIPQIEKETGIDQRVINKYKNFIKETIREITD